MWPLRRVTIVEAGNYTYQRLTVELEQAQDATSEAYGFSSSSRRGDQNIYEPARESSAKVDELEDQLRKQSTSLGALSMRDVETVDAISKLLRYEREIRTSLERALHELQRLQAVRLKGHGSVPAAIDVTVNRDLALYDGD